MDLMLDTNIVLDHVDRREPFYEMSRKVCLLGVAEEANTYVSVNTIADIFTLLREDYGSQAAQDMIERNLSFFAVRRYHAGRRAGGAEGTLERFRGLPRRAVRREDTG